MSRKEINADVDMTQGSIFKLLLDFALPLLVGNIFQQLYNTVDTWVLGNFAEKAAFAAVGTISPVFNLVVSTFIGLSSGASVVIANYYGANDVHKVKRAVHSSMVLALIGSVFFTVFGLTLRDVLIGLMNPSPEMVPHAKVYLGIIFQFLTFQLFYNMASSIMRAVGDSRRPFYYLVVACVINIALDLLFVIKFGMGAEGVAYATVIAQGVSSVLAVVSLFRVESSVKLSFKDMCFDLGIIKKVLKVGFPAAVQMAIISFSNLFVQSYINSFGTDFSGGYAAYFKADLIMFMPLQSIGLSTTTFVGQNYGAGKFERAREGVRTAIKMSLVATVVLGTVMFVFAPQITSFFNKDPNVMYYGALCIRLVTPFYLLQCFNQNMTSALRGIGDTFVPMLIMIGCFVALRQIYLYVFTNFVANVPVVVVLSYPVGWAVATALVAVRYLRKDFSAEFAQKVH